MSFLQELINQFKGWSTSEWSLFATCFIELAVILFYNKGTLKCKERLEQYESNSKRLTLIALVYKKYLRKGVRINEAYYNYKRSCA